ncbi:Guanylate kinase [Caenispirillum salinarum AK4]|uniref:Ribose 1,5-bisphosphate phosphokinase PhnN n=1 Tax=Caenispirillum salinarum AK4 TaxID=1238182 RepID=K9H1K0_9PROT|nr:phosphonate metabolism protein/1,5-bisphosphokinase (PRPP-forming) PhnN [Caenispirillum salinarum]EKV30944.1 Guanylate kinase [Caenispirillum salinarum AK4]
MTDARLIYVVGPSGAGKDTLIACARVAVDGRLPVAFAHRYITRPADAGGESHVALTEAEYAERLGRGLFAMAWDSHGLRYAIGREIDLWLDAGMTVVVNGSRAWLPRALALYPHLVPVVLTVAPDELRRRLIARGREAPEQIEARLARAAAFQVDAPSAVVIDNSGPIDQAVEALLTVLRAPLRQPA